MNKTERIRIVSEKDTTRAAASRIFLGEKEITHQVKDVKVFIGGETRRWNVELTIVAEVEINITADNAFSVSDPIDRLLSRLAYETGRKPPRNLIENWLIDNGVCTVQQIEGIRKRAEDSVREAVGLA